MKRPDPTPSKNSPQSTTPHDGGFSPWKRLKGKRISYLTLPLLFMATVTEFVILATGWKYQQVVCLPQGMGVTFFGIGPIGATILAVELLKLPMAIWTASRHGWQKVAMVCVGLPCICLLTFQLVKDMAVYEMGVAMAPATQMLEKATAEDVKIAQLNSQLAAIQEKKSDHEHRISELNAKQAKAKSDLEESLKHNEEVRHDAVSLTDYQRQELAAVENRESAIIVQFNSDTAQIQKAIADLRAAREVEVARAAKWNAEQARIDNAYQTKLADYNNRKALYDKQKVAYDKAGVLKRQLMTEPVSPGVPPQREANTILKPTPISEFDAQISAKEAELQTVNNKRRDRIAQVEAEAKSIREQFDKRSVSKREEADRKREELAAAEAALATQTHRERTRMDEDLTASIQKVDGIRAQIAICQKNADEYYAAREAAIRKTQVHRIATTVEIIRALIKGERPMTIKMSAKERGDILTDQISMVRIWVYPVLAFIVAFLPTLMVEIGFSTIFHPDEQRPQHRLGFFGSNLYQVMLRAGRQKILRAERMAKDAQGAAAARDRMLESLKGDLDKTATEKALELTMLRESLTMAQSEHEEQLKQKETAHSEKLRQLEVQNAEKLKKKTEEWEAKHAQISDSLNRSEMEKEELRNMQKAEIERQVQVKQATFSERLAQLQQELGEARAAAGTERATLLEEHHAKLSAVNENSKNQINQLRRQLAEVQLTGDEKTARLAEQLNEASFGRDNAEARLKDVTVTLSTKITQAQENAAREIEKAAREEKARNEKQQKEFEKKTRQLEEALDQRLKQREKDLAFEFENRLTAEKAKLEEEARVREAERARQITSRKQETEASFNTEIRKREETFETRLKQREQQLQEQANDRVKAVEAQAEERFRDRETEFAHQLESQARSAELRLRDELRKKDELLQAKIKEREQEWNVRSEARTSELLTQHERQLQLQACVREDEIRATAQEQLRQQQEEFGRRLEAQTLAAETRLREELRKKDERYDAKLKEREEELSGKSEARWNELLKQREQQLQAQGDARLNEELRKKDELLNAKLKEREQEWNAKAESGIAELKKQWAAEASAREEDLERRTKSRIAAAEARVSEEAKHNEELSLARVMQRDQQWQAKFDAVQLDYQGKLEEALRRRGAEADSALRALDAQLREEMQQKELAIQTRAAQREQEAIAQSKALWEAEVETRTFQAMESFRAMLTRAEAERDEARQAAQEATRRMDTLQKKLSEASSFFNSWRSGNSVSEPA